MARRNGSVYIYYQAHEGKLKSLLLDNVGYIEIEKYKIHFDSTIDK